MSENRSIQWPTERLAMLFSENSEKNAQFSESKALQFKYGEIIAKKQYELTPDLIDTYKKYTIIQPNDIMINGLNLNYDFVSQRVAHVTVQGIITPAYICLRPRGNVCSRFYTYYLKALDSHKVFNGMGTGIRLTLSYDLMKNMPLPVPARTEQEQIVRYLDWQVSKINRLIAAKKREIHLLKEYKQTQIADLVLGCNYPKDKLKRSGVMGFDAIPAHWTILPQKRVFKERVEHSTTGTETLLSVSRHYGVKPANALSEDEQFATIKPAQSLVGYKVVRKNDLAMNIMRAQNGSYGFSEYDGIISPAYCVYELMPGNDPVYMHYLLKTPQMISVFFAASSGITDHRRRLYPDDFLRVKITLPPIEEQQRIVAQIELIETSSKGKVEMVQQQIDCLTELRTRLISDVVTGQIDVRDIEIPDYEYTTDTDSDSDADEESDISDDSEEA